MGRLRAKQDYESLRNARITRNKARLEEALGLNRIGGELPSIVSSAKSVKRVRGSIMGSASTQVRRSVRLNAISGDLDSSSLQDSGKSEVEKRIDDHVSEIEGNESLRNAGISENKARMPSLGLDKNVRETQIISSSANSSKSTKKLKPDSATPSRQSVRLMGISSDFDSSSPKDPSEEIEEQEEERSMDSCKIKDDQVSGFSEYESLRNARISENMARMAELGLDRKLRELHELFFSAKSSAKTNKTTKKQKLDLATPCRQSDRLKGKSGGSDASTPQALSAERQVLMGRSVCSERVKRRLFSHAERCGSEGRGSIYGPILGICCHFCRQKKLCGEEDCKRCGDSDADQPCIGKTECSACHSSQGVLCRACLKVRYGEDIEEVRKNKDWMCPHCIEENGINPYWICNSSLCLKKRKMVPTGIAIYYARQEGYESVAHMIMDKLKRTAGCQ